MLIDSFDDLADKHPLSRCNGRRCVIHNPTTHKMSDWPMNWRDDIKMVERLCEHGIGHPDPDAVYFFDTIGKGGLGIHGCDGCCHEEEDGEDLEPTALDVIDDEPDHIFKAGQVWQDYGGKRIIILSVDGEDVTHCSSDGHDIVISPAHRVLPYSEWGLVFPNPILPGTVWKHIESHNTDLAFVLTAPDSKGRIDVAVANTTEVFEWHMDVILKGYTQVRLRD